MAYEKLRELAQRLVIDADEARELVEAYADGLEEDEPHATRSIRAARDTASALSDAIEGEI